jgi:hypothetical protein
VLLLQLFLCFKCGTFYMAKNTIMTWIHESWGGGKFLGPGYWPKKIFHNLDLLKTICILSFSKLLFLTDFWKKVFLCYSILERSLKNQIHTTKFWDKKILGWPVIRLFFPMFKVKNEAEPLKSEILQKYSLEYLK